MGKEIWCDVERFEDRYQVSSLGRIRTKDREFDFLNHGTLSKRKYRGRIMKPRKDRKGYLRVNLYDGKCYERWQMHRLVAKHFILNTENKPAVNHINGVKDDNTIQNLEWVTYSENQIHARDTGLNKFNAMGKKAINIETGEIFPSAMHAYRSLNLPYGDTYFHRQMSGKIPNKTPIRYYESQDKNH